MLVITVNFEYYLLVIAGNSESTSNPSRGHMLPTNANLEVACSSRFRLFNRMHGSTGMLG